MNTSDRQSPTIAFEYLGRSRTLFKSSVMRQRYLAGTIELDQLLAGKWYLRFRVKGKTTDFPLPPDNTSAIKAAKDILKGQRQQPGEFTEFLAAKGAMKSVTYGTLAAEWFALGLPFDKLNHRKPTSAEALKATTERALVWWANQPIEATKPTTLSDFAAQRKNARSGKIALRSVDLELSAMSSLCQWARAAGKIDCGNPFADRGDFQQASAIKHCYKFCPNDDEELHKFLAFFFAPDTIAPCRNRDYPRDLKLAGGTLCFEALSGLRPGEAKFLKRLPVIEQPKNVATLQLGQMFRDRDGVLRMHVHRLKMRGEEVHNPYITVHPAMERFLSAWKAWLARELPDHDMLFPMFMESTFLNRAVNSACATCELPRYKPHGVGRAYYVKVRRSQGKTDPEIAAEVGQTTDGKLIRTTYGKPGDLFGGNFLDWLPEDTAPAWDILALPSVRRVQARPIPNREQSKTALA